MTVLTLDDGFEELPALRIAEGASIAGDEANGIVNGAWHIGTAAKDIGGGDGEGLGDLGNGDSPRLTLPSYVVTHRGFGDIGT